MPAETRRFNLVPAARGAAALAVALACMLGVFGNSTLAQSAPPDPAKLIEALKEKSVRGAGQPAAATAGAAETTRERLIADLKAKATRGLSVDDRSQLSAIVAQKPAVDLEVFFDLDSAEITARARPTLDSLGKALQDPNLKGKTFMVAGHTDASGSLTHNQELSERRANSVKGYLAKNFGIAVEQLMAVGYGPERLKKPEAPRNGVNRRVEVVNLGQ